MSKTTSMKVGGERRSVHLVGSERDLPHTSRYWGCGSYSGYCVKLWRCEGKFYCLVRDVMACYEGSAQEAL